MPSMAPTLPAPSSTGSRPGHDAPPRRGAAATRVPTVLNGGRRAPLARTAPGHGAPTAGAGVTVALALLGALLAPGCSDSGEAPQRAELFVFGTLVEVTLYGADEPDAVTARLERALRQRHAAWHPWEESTLTRFGEALRRDGEAPIPPALDTLLRRGQTLADATGHRMDPGVGRLAALWGFHADDAATPRTPPATAAIEQWRSAPDSIAELDLGRTRAATESDALRLDFGAVAKGVALDALRASLEGAHLDAALVNAGGDLITVGRPADRAWRVGVRDPDGDAVLLELAVAADRAVFTSGDYERGFHHDGTWYHHILDPRRGTPARGLRAATVIDTDAALADAAATALLVAGPEDWKALAAALDLEAVLVVARDGTVLATGAMAERIREAQSDVRTIDLP